MAFSGVIREADTEEAANTAEARGRRSVAAARAGLPAPTINPPRPSQPTGQQAAGQATGETTGQTDPFGALIGLLRDSLIVFGVPTRGMLANAKETRKRQQAAEDYNTVTTATLNMQDLFGGMNRGPVRTAAAEAHIAQLERSFPGLGEPVRTAWDAVENQGVDLPSAIEHRDRALAVCGTGLGAQDCINDLFRDEGTIQQWNDEADQDRLPDITDRFNLIADAVRQSGGDDVLKQLAKGGWDLAELRRLPKEFQFTDNQLRTINRNEEIQNSLISVGLNPASLDVKSREAEITEGTKAKFRKLAERATAKDANNRLRFTDTGDLVFPDIDIKAEKRKTATAADGRLRFIDDGELVFPDVTADPKELPSLTFKEIEEDGKKVIVGIDPKKGNVVSRVPAGKVSRSLTFKKIREDGQEFIVGLGSVDGKEVMRMAAGPVAGQNLRFKEIEEDGDKFLVGLDATSGQEVSRMPSGTVKPVKLTFKEIEEGDNKFIIGLDENGVVKSRQPSGTVAAPAGTNLTKLQKERGAAEAAGDTRLAEELNKKIIKEITITGRTPEDVRTGLTGATPKDLDELRSGIRDMQGNLEELEKTRKAFEANPEAGGILGTLLEKAGGLLGQVPFIGEDLADLLPGDQEKVKKARTQARFTVASMLTTITKEETGRFTDTERAIAQEAVSALDVTASPPQIQAALETAIDIMTDSQNRKVDELLSASGLNLPGDLEKFHKILRENLFTQDQADNAILDVMARRGIPFE